VGDRGARERGRGREREREREGGTKNEDEVNDIHAGYRILPSEPVRGYHLFVFLFSSSSSSCSVFFFSSSLPLRLLSLSPFRASYGPRPPVFHAEATSPIFLTTRKSERKRERIEQSRGSWMREDPRVSSRLVSSRLVAER
jgi:hypothetical protein